MYPTASSKEDYEATKRLTEDQQSDARADSGPGSDPPILLQKKPLSGPKQQQRPNARYAETREVQENE
jgi:hypothetical protein